MPLRRASCQFAILKKGGCGRIFIEKVAGRGSRRGTWPLALQPHEGRSNVVPLIRMIEAVPVGPPEWAYGTSLLVGPSDWIEAWRWFQERKRA